MCQLILYTSDSLGETFVVGGLSGLLGFVIIYGIISLVNRGEKKKQEKEYQLKKTEAFVKSDSDGNGKYYHYLLDELLDKCNPQNFMKPYNYEKVRIANELYPQLLNCKKDDNDKLVSIRQMAINKLGINITTQSIFEVLCKLCNPQQFMNPYNPEKVAKANELYSRILENKNNIIALEKIRDEISDLFGDSNFTQSIFPNTAFDNTEKPISYLVIIAIVSIIILIAFFIVILH